jgi:hypothetical protein
VLCQNRSQGGVAVTVEFVLSQDRPTPMLPATFALAVLVLTTKGDACTFARLKEMLRRAGRRTLGRKSTQVFTATLTLFERD